MMLPVLTYTVYGESVTNDQATSQPVMESADTNTAFTGTIASTDINSNYDAEHYSEQRRVRTSVSDRAMESKAIVDRDVTDVFESKKGKGYVSTGILNIRKFSNKDSDKIGEIYFGEKVTYYLGNTNSYPNEEGFVPIKYGKEIGYINTEFLQDDDPIKDGVIRYAVQQDKAGRKSMESYTSITCTTSRQYYLQTIATSDPKTGIRMINGRYLIGVGSYYTHNIGQYVDVILENGEIIPCIIGDAKQDIHTYANCSIGLDGGAVEFIADFGYTPSICYGWGSMSYNPYADWYSSVKALVLYNQDIA